MSRVEKGLHAYFAAGNDTGAKETTIPEGGPASGESMQTPFAKVNSVMPGSPAEEAGLVAGDQITVFGTANAHNHDKLQRIAQLVAQNDQVSQRQGQCA